MAVSPVPGGRVGGGYGERPCHTTRGATCVHAGWDFVAAEGDPVGAADRGVVVGIFHNNDIRSRMRGYGNVVVVAHEDGTWTSYNHMKRNLVALGQELEEGQQLGEVGRTTNGRYFISPHLHFEARHAKPNGSNPFPGAYGRFNIDPAEWFRARGQVAASIPGVLAPAALGEYEPDHVVEPTLFQRWDRALLGSAILNVGYRLGTGSWLVLKPFESKRERRERAANVRRLGDAPCAGRQKWWYGETADGEQDLSIGCASSASAARKLALTKRGAVIPRPYSLTGLRRQS